MNLRSQKRHLQTNPKKQNSRFKIKSRVSVFTRVFLMFRSCAVLACLSSVPDNQLDQTHDTTPNETRNRARCADSMPSSWPESGSSHMYTNNMHQTSRGTLPTCVKFVQSRFTQTAVDRVSTLAVTHNFNKHVCFPHSHIQHVLKEI